MLPENLTLDEFDAVDYAAWRALAERDLKGAPFEKKLVAGTYEGIAVQPIYTKAEWADDAARGAPGETPFVRGARSVAATTTGWTLCQEHAHPDLAETNRAVLDDVQGGVDTVLLRLDAAARNGLDPDAPAATELAARDGLAAYTVDDLDAALTGVDLTATGVALEAGAAYLPAAALLAALHSRRGGAAAALRADVNADPLAVLARDGSLPAPADVMLSQLADLAAWARGKYPAVRTVRVGTAPYHHAGATSAQDLGFALATGVQYLRAMTAAGVSVDDAARQIVFNMALGAHHFLAIAKLRAARRLWSRVVEASGGSPAAGAMQLHAKTSKRVLTVRDPHVNLLRNTAAMFAAATGGAEVITSVPFDAPIGLPDGLSRRTARNTAIILGEEGHLHRVADPAGGSWYLEWLTDQLAEKGWAELQKIEQQGGMLAALESGWVAREIESAFAPRAKKLADRREGIVGVSEFADANQTPLQRPAPDRGPLVAAAQQRVAAVRQSPGELQALAATVAGGEPGASMDAAQVAAEAGATIGQLAAALELGKGGPSLAPLSPSPFAQPFEELRDACEAWAVANGHRPRVVLATLGRPAQHGARSQYAGSFFAAGGFEVIADDAISDVDGAVAAIREHQAPIAVICSTDDIYAEQAAVAAAALKAAGVGTVVLAGNPGAKEDEYRAAGIDRFIFIKCDVLATLRELLAGLGVLNA